MYAINTGWIFNMIYNASKFLIEEEVVAKFQFLDSNYSKELQKIIPIDQIPKEFGGTGPSLEDIPL